MARSKNILKVAGAGLGILGLCGVARAQDTDTVGPPVLRDFSISGERATPPPAEEQPTATPPAAEQPAETAPPPVTLDIPPPAAATPTPARPEQARRVEAPSGPSTEPAPVAVAPVEESPVLATRPAPAATSPDVQQQPAPAIPVPDGNLPWIYIFLAGIGTVLALLALVRLRRGLRGREAEAEPFAEELLLADEPAPIQKVVPRPRIELEFKPGKAAATDAQASVEYELRIVNVGDSDARNVRVEARLFNAQQDGEIGAFFSAPDRARATLAPRPIAPKGGALFKSSVALPKEQVREVIIQGRRLFIPMVAFNVLYEWGEGEAGQTSMSYIVGRESEPPAEKMAPFRMDLGPRIYRSVGFRPSKLALTV